MHTARTEKERQRGSERVTHTARTEREGDKEVEKESHTLPELRVMERLRKSHTHCQK